MKIMARMVRHGGFSLVEVVLALGIASFCLIGLLALLPAGLSSNKDAIQKTIASGFAAEVAADLRNTPLVLLPSGAQADATSQRFQFTIPGTGKSNTMTDNPQTIYLDESGSAGQVGMTPTTDSRYRVSVGFSPPSTNGYGVTLVRILVTWPALANSNPNTWPAVNNGGASGSYEVITALDRN